MTASKKRGFLARLRAFGKKSGPAPKKDAPPLPENPYRRFYTPPRRLEDLTRPKK